VIAGLFHRHAAIRYFDRSSQERVVDQVARSLIPGGYLILGKVETLLGATRGQFVPVAQRERIFRKVS
jgi:chemotaxis protein methyltransferase CheR